MPATRPGWTVDIRSRCQPPAVVGVSAGRHSETVLGGVKILFREAAAPTQSGVSEPHVIAEQTLGGIAGWVRALRLIRSHREKAVDSATAMPYHEGVNEFEWSPAKANTNFMKHGVSFAAAARVFEDMQRIEWEDTREDYGEDRFVTVGMVDSEVLSVVYTVRADVIRIISARRATIEEKREYYGNRPV